jgi:hypothetical protein
VWRALIGKRKRAPGDLVDLLLLLLLPLLLDEIVEPGVEREHGNARQHNADDDSHDLFSLREDQPRPLECGSGWPTRRKGGIKQKPAAPRPGRVTVGAWLAKRQKQPLPAVNSGIHCAAQNG